VDLADCRVGKVLDLAEPLPQLVEHDDAAFNQRAAVDGGGDALRGAVEERYPQGMLHFGNGIGNGRLRNAQVSRSLRHAARLGCRLENVQVAQLYAPPDAVTPTHESLLIDISYISIKE
jgi:hypothetical protein